MAAITQPEINLDDHAKYLAKLTPLTESEATSYLYWYFAEDEMSQRSIAKKRGVSESTFSEQLSNGREKMESDDATFDMFAELIARSPICGSTGRTKQVIDATETPNAYVLICEDATYATERLTGKYEAYLIYRSLDEDKLLDGAPDDIIHYDKWTTFSIEGESEEHFVRSVDYYVRNLDALDNHDVFAVLKMLKDSHFDTAADYLTEATQELQ